MRPIRIRGAALWLALSLSACAPQADDAAGSDRDAGIAGEVDDTGEASAEDLPQATCLADQEPLAPTERPAKAAAVEVTTAEVDPDQLAALPVIATPPPANPVSAAIRQRQDAYLSAVAERESGWSDLDAAARDAAQADLKAEMLGGDL